MAGRTTFGVSILALALMSGAWGDTPAPKPLISHKPVKISSAEAAGPIFQRSFAFKSNEGADGPSTEVVLLRSKDQKVEMGVYEAGPSEQDIAAYEDDEFMFFVDGSVTLTSADGTVLVVSKGEGVAIPKGWKGHWSTKGYKKYYVTYSE